MNTIIFSEPSTTMNTIIFSILLPNVNPFHNHSKSLVTNGERGWQFLATPFLNPLFSHFNTQPSHTTLLTNQNSCISLTLTLYSFSLNLANNLGSLSLSHQKRFRWPSIEPRALISSSETHKFVNRQVGRKSHSKIFALVLCCACKAWKLQV